MRKLLAFVWAWRASAGAGFASSSLPLRRCSDLATANLSLAASSRVYVGVGCVLKLQACERVAVLNLHADNSSSCLVEWRSANASARFVTSWRVGFSALFWSCRSLELDVVVGSASKFELTFINALTSSSVSVHVKLARASAVDALSSCLLARAPSSWVVDAVAEHELADIRLVYDALASSRAAVTLAPKFGLRSSTSRCVHSVNVSCGLGEASFYLTNRLLTPVDVCALKAYCQCTA
ncbi:hypothetical protein HCDSEM_038 [Candidatus Hodgkinia cicadicola Dsem]|nr:hypothetical protein HCDSEM_038 [Candidatus Hodgkinia cicadicola Dsem]